MDVCRIFVVRHGQTTYNRDDIISGHDVDPELTDEGRAQAQRTQARLSHITFDTAYSSDLQRAADTAAIIYGKPVHPRHRIPELRERKFGAIDGMPNHHLRKLRSSLEVQGLSDAERWTHKLAEDMESDQEVALRFERALTRVARQNLGKTILVGSHGGTLRTLLIHLGYAKSTAELPYGSIENAAYAELLYDGSKFSFGEVSGVHLRPR